MALDLESELATLLVHPYQSKGLAPLHPRIVLLHGCSAVALRLNAKP